jgi:hypothetical protein
MQCKAQLAFKLDSAEASFPIAFIACRMPRRRAFVARSGDLPTLFEKHQFRGGRIGFPP